MEKYVCLIVLSVNSVYKFSEMYLQIYSSYLSKMALVRSQYELVSLDANKVCFEEEQ